MERSTTTVPRNVRHALGILGLISAVAFGTPSDIKINEVHYHPAGNDQPLEFVELYNSMWDAVDLSGWRFADGIAFTFPQGTTLAGRSYLIVAKDAALARTVYGDIRILGNYSDTLSDGGEWIRLLDASGRIIDEFRWNDTNSWPEASDGRGASLERLAPRKEGDWGDNWNASLVVNGTPGRINSYYRTYEARTLVGAGATWRYFKGTQTPPANWTAIAFDDSLWLSGPSGFGYADNDDATVLGDMLSNYSTVYIRKSFFIPDVNFTNLTLQVSYDDGFVAYLNGHEVARYFAPGNPGELVLHTALATGSHEYIDGNDIFDISSYAGHLVAGNNVLAIVGLNQTAASSDFSLAPSLDSVKEVLGIDEAMGRDVDEPVIPRGAEWSYFEGVEEPAAGWWDAAFDASAWLSGPAGFGYGDNDDATVLADMMQVPGVQSGYSTVYVRRTFELQEDPATVFGMLLNISYDDGFVAYLNGVEVARTAGVVGNPPPYDALDTLGHEAAGFQQYNLVAFLGALRQGTNCLALIGLNQILTSTDFSLHPELILQRTVRARPEALECPVRVNEVVPHVHGGWVELVNAGVVPSDVSGYRVTVTARNTLLCAIPAGTALQPGEHLVLDEADLGMQIPLEGTMLIADPTGILLVDGREYAVPAGGVACARYPDGQGPFKVVYTATRGAANAAPPQWNIVISEIMYHPAAPAGAVESEWIELFNAGAGAVDLSGWEFTRGIGYVVPEGVTMGPGEYLVVARNPAAVAAQYGIANVIGGYASGLKNDDERITIRDALRNEVDLVHYADDGTWPPEADGFGPSLELTHPALHNTTGQAWAASSGSGTPGAPNSAADTQVRPLIRKARHFPPVPTSASPVVITAEVSCPTSPLAAVEVGWRIDGTSTFTVVPMHDDGAHEDGRADDGLFGVVLAPFANGARVCCYVTALTEAGRWRVVPPQWETDQTVTMLFQVQDTIGFWPDPTYRVIMTQARLTELQTRDAMSEVPLDCTVISGNGIFYNVDIRYRGKSSRYQTPKSYRVDFHDDEDFQDMKYANLNGYVPDTQHLGMTMFRLTDIPAPLSRMVRLVVNNTVTNRYVHMEAVQDEFLSRRFVDDDEGNLYRGEANANLDYRGTNKESYRASYPKRTNEELDDYSDIIDLCDKFTNTPADQFSAVIGTVIDAREWARFFAVHTIIGTQEGGIYRDTGDDYYLYRRPSDGRFVLIPWDLDDTFANPTERLFRPTLPTIVKFLQHPDFSPHYYAAMKELTGGHFGQTALNNRMDDIAHTITPARLSQLQAFTDARRTFVDSQIPVDFTVNVTPWPLVSASDTWRYFRGTAEPSGGNLSWTQTTFSDSGWLQGPGGIGYGDNDDATVLSDMLNRYTTVYLRRAFTVADPAAITQLLLTINFDDGFVAYLNGTEIARCNAPGAPGSFVPYSARATMSYEAGVPITVAIDNAQALLRAGTNVLAVQGINEAAGSSDFSLAPTLGLGAVIGQGCADTLYVAGPHLLITGQSSVAETRYVRINGVDAAYNSLTGAFSGPIDVTGGQMTVTVDAIRPDLTLYTRTTLTLTGVSSIGGALAGDTTLTPAGGPYLIGTELAVPRGITLTIAPGTQFVMSTAGIITVNGTLQAIGTEAEPIVFDCRPCFTPGNTVNFDQTIEDNRLVWCQIRNAGAQGNNPAAVTARSSKFLVDSCLFSTIAGVAIQASSCDVTVRNTEIAAAAGGIRTDWCRPAVLENNYIHHLTGTVNGIEANGSTTPPAAISYCLIESSGGNGIRSEGGAINAVGNELRRLSSQGVSLHGSGRSTLSFNLIHHNAVGVAVKDSHFAAIDHQTIADNTNYGLRCVEETAGRGGADARVTSTILYFNATPFAFDAQSTISFDYCDVAATPVPSGVANFNADPLFVNRTAYNYALTPASPCVGTGANTSDVGAVPYNDTPRAPANLSVVGTTPASIDIAWSDSSSNEAGFEVHRKAPGETEFSLLATLGAGVTTYHDEGLVVDEIYTYRVRAFNDKGFSGWSNEASQQTGTIPQAPSLLAVTSVGPESIALAWQDNADTETGFELERKGPGEWEFTALAALPADTTAYVDATPPLTQGAVYEYRVRAFNGSGASGWSNVVSQQTGRVPSAPTNLRLLEAGASTATIAWNDNADNEVAYVVEMRSDPADPWLVRAVLGADVTTLHDAGLESGRTYSYRVRAENDAGVSAWLGPISAELGSVPAVPFDVSVADTGLDWILVAWRDGSDKETGFEIERQAPGGAFELVATLPVDATTYGDTAIGQDREFAYRVRAFNSYGASPWSPVVSGRTGMMPPAPGNLRIALARLDYVTILWDDLSDNEASFEIERRQDSGTWESVTIVPADWYAYTDYALSQDTEYTYRVRSVNRFGASAWSNEATARTAALPPPPGNLRVVGSGLDTLMLAWDDASAAETFFEIEQRPASGGTWVMVGLASIDQTLFLVEGLQPGTAYRYRVRAGNRYGTSGYSNEAVGATGTLPAAPVDLRESAWNENGIALAWIDRAVDETSFVVKRRSGAEGAFLVVADVPANTTAWTDSELVAGEQYAYMVFAANDFGVSAPTNIVYTCAGVSISAITPDRGSIDGGDPVMIEGVHLRASVTVLIGGKPVTSLTLISEGVLTGVVPAGDRAGPVDVVIRDGAYENTFPDGFQYAFGLLRGDVNGNRRMSLADAMYILDYLFHGGDAPYCASLADTNFDGRVNIADVVYLLEYLFGRGPAPAPRRVDC